MKWSKSENTRTQLWETGLLLDSKQQRATETWDSLLTSPPRLREAIWWSGGWSMFHVPHLHPSWGVPDSTSLWVLYLGKTLVFGLQHWKTSCFRARVWLVPSYLRTLHSQHILHLFLRTMRNKGGERTGLVQGHLENCSAKPTSSNGHASLYLCLTGPWTGKWPSIDLTINWDAAYLMH